MKNFKDWLSSQLLSKYLLSARSFNFYDEDPLREESSNQDAINTTNGIFTTSSGTNDTQLTESAVSELVVPDISLTKAEALQIKFLRLLRRIGQSRTEQHIVSKVLNRLHLVSLIQISESGVERNGVNIDQSKAIAAQQEAAGQPDLDFSFKILVLGKTGVGKSATINSLFDQTKAETNAFQPATNKIQEIVGTIKGIRVTVIDTPGLSPSQSDQRRNRKNMIAVKKFIRKSSPDIVLYCERIDFINRGYSDYPLLKLISDVFGSSIWFNTILVMTHASSPHLEGPDGYPLNYEGYVGRATKVVQHSIHQAISSTQLENCIALVENHPLCKTNVKGEKILPNGRAWMPQFLLLCLASKILGEANTLLKSQDSFLLSQTGNRVPSLPHLLSSFLRPRSLSNSNGIEDDDLFELSGQVEEDEYDQLPPIRILTKAQFQKLSKAQKNAYLDELDYRETLYLRKQWKAEVRRHKERMLHNNGTLETDHDYENNVSPPEAVQMPDMAIPLSFDSDSPVYRYRCVLGNEQWLVRPVLDSQGWDHDVGYDGINLEASLDIKRNLQASVMGQMNKEKADFRIHSESTAKFINLNGPSILAGIDIQNAGKDLVCTVHGDVKLRNLCWNSTGGGLSLTSFGKMYFAGGKFEDSISLGRRLKVQMNAGCLGGCGQIAHGGSLEATIKGDNYPVRDEKVTIATTLLSFNKEMVLGGSVQSDFRVGRDAKLSFNANLNSRQTGQICFKASTSEHVEIALVAFVSLFQALFLRRRRRADAVE
ncbi:hypothetical protein J5N97_002683 [Dioscorea zingiberensis]|uniref:AIG1-type G domain-containing protein n=1 Tax=Dioscorea zingiberensis TaxID=325984 RepID=A0A9D5D4R8_9LILI|nr:hypothetical protein J5N97_002683 [Dioscorea zingiberensis]